MVAALEVDCVVEATAPHRLHLFQRRQLPQHVGEVRQVHSAREEQLHDVHAQRAVLLVGAIKVFQQLRHGVTGAGSKCSARVLCHGI